MHDELRAQFVLTRYREFGRAGGRRRTTFSWNYGLVISVYATSVRGYGTPVAAPDTDRNRTYLEDAQHGWIATVLAEVM